MRKNLFAVGIFFLLLCVSAPAHAFGGAQSQKEGAGWAEPDGLLEELDFSDISSFLEEQEETQISFEDLVKSFLEKDGKTEYETLGAYIKDMLVKSLGENKALFLELLTVSLAFSLLKNFAKSFSASYISEICFLVCYCFIMLLMFESFRELSVTLQNTTDNMLTFMKLFVPTYCAAMSFSMNLNSSGAVYSMIFMVIYLVEWLLRYLLLPMVRIYVMIEFLNHFAEGERLRRLAELVSDGVKTVLKLSVTLILGINIIQGMVTPAMDRLTGNTIARTVQMLPGIGNVMSGTGQIFLSSGIVIKNCVGAAALAALVLLCGVPFLKMACAAALYKLLAAVVEPVTDKRISGGMNGIANGGILCLKIMTTCLMLLFLTIALSSAATNLNVGG